MKTLLSAMMVLSLSFHPNPQSLSKHCPNGDICFFAGKNFTGRSVKVSGPLNTPIQFAQFRFDNRTESWIENATPPRICFVTVWGEVQGSSYLLWEEITGTSSANIGKADADQAVWFQITGCS